MGVRKNGRHVIHFGLQVVYGSVVKVIEKWCWLWILRVRCVFKKEKLILQTQPKILKIKSSLHYAVNK